MVKVAIIGGSGYTGAELVRLLSLHNEVEVSLVTSETHKGKKVSELYPSFVGVSDLVFESLDISKVLQNEVIFIALPHGTSMKLVPDLVEKGSKVIDLSGDFRLKSVRIYEQWYKMKHQASELLGRAVYGLPEVNREEIKAADFVTNPGCYPTSAVLALAPLVIKDLIKGEVLVDAKSGVSGAGKEPKAETHFCQIDENIKAYNIGMHRHAPEMEQVLSDLGKSETQVLFVPHLIPINRGILSSCYTQLTESSKAGEVYKTFCQFYQDEPFVNILDEGKYPETKHVFGSNYCQIGVKVDERTGKIIAISAIDNLVKGASGQAIQNMNLMCGFDETEGLKQIGVYP